MTTSPTWGWPLSSGAPNTIALAGAPLSSAPLETSAAMSQCLLLLLPSARATLSSATIRCQQVVVVYIGVSSSVIFPSCGPPGPHTGWQVSRSCAQGLDNLS